MDIKNLLYLMPSFKPVASHLRASFIDMKVKINNEPQEIWIARDSMGLCWVHFEKPFPKGGRVMMENFSASADQTLRSWFPLQIQIQTRVSRFMMVVSLIQEVIDSSEPDIQDYCVPRCAIYRHQDGSMNYHYEILNGTDPEVIAHHIGNAERLLSSEMIEKGYIQPPKRIRRVRVVETDSEDDDH